MLRCEERALRAVEEVMPWPHGEAWSLYVDVLHRALGGRDSAAVSLEEVRRCPGGAALMDSSAESLLSLGWAEAVREPTPSLRVFPSSLRPCSDAYVRLRKTAAPALYALCSGGVRGGAR